MMTIENQDLAERPATLDFRGIAVSVLEAAGGDRNEALRVGQKQMRSYLTENPSRALDVVMPILSNKLWDVIRELAPDGRPKAAHPPGGSGPHTGAGLSALGRDYVYAFVLPGGQKLGDAIKDDVERARKIYAATAQENTRNALWLAAIAREMGDETTVKKTFTEERLSKMLKGARDEAAKALFSRAKELTTR